MNTLIAGLLLAFAASLVMTRVAIVVAFRWGILDRPDGFRKLHRSPIPRLGGLGIFVAVWIPVLILLWRPDLTLVADVLFWHHRAVAGLFMGSLVALLVGLWDDWAGVRPLGKLAGQALAGGCACWAGMRIDVITNPLGGAIELGIFAIPVTILWFVGCMNAINLLDGLDGLAAGVSMFVCMTLLVLGVLFQNTFGMFFMAVLSGALMGFLPYNFPPARIYMGDSGSMLVGVLVDGISLVGAQRKAETAVAILAPIIVLGIPLFDAFLAVVRRWYHHVPISFPDRHHVHHVLVGMGYSPRRAVMILYGGTVILGGAALMVTMNRGRLVLLIIGALLMLVYVGVRVFGQVGFRDVVGRLLDGQEERDRRTVLRVSIEQSGLRMRQAASLQELWEACCTCFEAMQVSRVRLQAQRTGKTAMDYRWARTVTDDQPDPPERSADCWTMTMGLRCSGSVCGTLAIERRGARAAHQCMDCELLEKVRWFIEMAPVWIAFCRDSAELPG